MRAMRDAPSGVPPHDQDQEIPVFYPWVEAGIAVVRQPDGAYRIESYRRLVWPDRIDDDHARI